MASDDNLPQILLGFTGTFEAELLTELMLRFWSHPLAADESFRSGLLESAAEVLLDASRGTRLLEEVPANEMNLVAALWFAEFTTLTTVSHKDSVLRERQEWLTRVRSALPSCFCDQSSL